MVGEAWRGSDMVREKPQKGSEMVREKPDRFRKTSPKKTWSGTKRLRNGQGEAQKWSEESSGPGRSRKGRPPRLPRAKLWGLRKYNISVTVLGDQAWRPLRGAVGRLCSSAEPAMVSLSARLRPPTPTEVRGVAGGFRVRV